jgi:hypothetical protein
MCRAAAAVLVLLLALPGSARAAEAPDERVRVEVDGDPFDEPGFLHGNEGWSTQIRGYGMNWELIGALGPGFFAGVGATFLIRTYTYDASATAVERHQVFVGPHIGWRFELTRHLYVAPSLAVQYAYRGDEVTVNGETFDDKPYVIFPTVYLGWKF